MLVNAIIENDRIPTRCYDNLTENERAQILIDILKHERQARTSALLYDYFGLLPLPFAVIGLLLGIVFIAVVYVGISKRRISRKMYIFLLNRSVGDVIGCITAIVVSAYALFSGMPRRGIISNIDVIFLASYWGAMVSYVSLSLLKLFVVAKPLYYKKIITMRKCVCMIGISWVPPVAIGISVLIVHFCTFKPELNKLTGCRIETCITMMIRIKESLSIAAYFLTIVAFLLTIVLIRRARRFVKSFDAARSNKGASHHRRKGIKVRFPTWKLTLNVSTFAALYAFPTIVAVGSTFVNDSCYTVLHYVEFIKLSGVVRAILLLRIIIDPILSFTTDSQLRRVFLDCLARLLYRKPLSANLEASTSLSTNNRPEHTINAIA
uniref:G-protein coupled receptors family 1 profile domain-containing protein n=1 Tax=Plectus sambesii TaxID=2011161 RepID=A0A914W8J1_9BILA